jgi:hypothetical protein
MIFKKDNVVFGCILGLVAPVLGLLVFKNYNFKLESYKDTINFMLHQSGHQVLSAGLSVALLLNALLFTIYINTNKDKTAIGIFVTTLVYGIIILLLKTFG